jgi:hypothetical protein
VNTKRIIKPHKGGRDDRIYARITKEAKVKLLARVKAEGYKSLGDWLEAQAVAQPTKREPDVCNVTVYKGFGE